MPPELVMPPKTAALVMPPEPPEFVPPAELVTPLDPVALMINRGCIGRLPEMIGPWRPFIHVIRPYDAIAELAGRILEIKT